MFDHDNPQLVNWGMGNRLDIKNIVLAAFTDILVDIIPDQVFYLWAAEQCLLKTSRLTL